MDFNDLSEADFQTLKAAFYKHKVLVVKDQANLDSYKQFEWCTRLDPGSTGHHGHFDAEKTHRGNKSLLAGIANKGFEDLHPEVVLIGGGVQPERFQGRKITQAHHRDWHHS